MDENIIQIKNVVDGGYCVGCGTCAYIAKCDMNINPYGEYIPDIAAMEKKGGEFSKSMVAVCPSLRPDLNEDVLSEKLFSTVARHDSNLGYVQETYASYAKEGEFRSNGTSGGMGTWIAIELLKHGLIDGVIHVKAVERNNTSDPFFSYGVSKTEQDIQSASKTRYHVVEVSKVLDIVNQTKGRYLFIGVPCIVKAIRRLQLEDSSFAEKIPFVVSLVCGHLKSINWSLSLAWGAEISPENTAAIQYRTKGDDIPARAYVYQATSKNKEVRQKDSAGVVGGKFNSGALMLSACDYCDDVVGETADLTIGDAWIPRFEVDSYGTNLLIVRNTVIHDLLKSANESDRIMMTKISNEEATNSQSGGFRQRREGLSYRLEREKGNEKWVPVKRISPGQIPTSTLRKKIYDERSAITIKSRELFREALIKNDYSIYVNDMTPALKKLRMMEMQSSFFRLAFNKLNRIFLTILSRNIFGKV